MNGYADFKANTIQLIDSVTVYDGTHRSTLTTTTLSGTNLVISNANLSGTTTGVTVNASENSSKLATTEFVKAQGYATTTALTDETTRATTAEDLKENVSNKSTNVSTDALSDTMYPSVKAVKTYVDDNNTLGENTTTGSVSIAGGMTTSGTIYIGSAMTTSTGGINIGTGLTTGSVNIATTAQTTGNVNVGRAGGTGKFVVRGGGISTANITPETTTSSISIAQSTTGVNGVNLGNTSGGNSHNIYGTLNVNRTTTNGFLCGADGGTNIISINGEVGINNTSGICTIGRTTGNSTTINSPNITLGVSTTPSSTTGLFGATVNINHVQGATTIGNSSSELKLNSPIKIGYTTPTRSLAGLSFSGGFLQVIESSVTLTTTLTARCYTGGLVPNGRYNVGVYVYIPAAGAIGDYVTKLAYQNASFLNGSTTGFQSALTDGQIENYFYKQNTTSIVNITSQNPFDIGSGFGYMAVAIRAPASVTGCKIIFNILRV